MSTQYVSADSIVVTWTCVKCRVVQVATNVAGSLYLSGGCGGHSPDEYCYCPDTEYNLDTKCSECNTKAVVKL
jgi:hypothetical protein